MKQSNQPRNCTRRDATQTGFSLVELMVAITIGLLLMAGLTGIFVTSNAARSEVEKTNRQIEDGRYASYLLAEDLRMAGFLAEFDPTVLSTPATKPDACATELADLRTALPLHVQGYDGGAALTCLSDVRAGTDILVIRRAATCVAGAAGCDPLTNGVPYFQASLCNGATELGSADYQDHYSLGIPGTGLTRRQRDCTTTANRRQYVVHIYFIANNDVGSDGIPTLKKAVLGAGSFSIVPLVEGIENLQIEYGIDTSNDGAPDAYTPNPDSFNACAGADCVDNWRNVVTAKLHLLARNTKTTAGHSDTKTYTLGLTADGSDNTFGPFNDSVKRHAYQSVVRLINPAGRKEP